MQITTRQVTSLASSKPPAAAAPPPTKDSTGKDLEQATPAPPPAVPRHIPTSTFDELFHTVRTSGWGSLFSGLSASLVGTTVSQGVYFYLYSLLRQAVVERRASAALSALADSRSSEVTVAESLLVAALAGMGNVLLTNPIWMIATRMQAHQKLTRPKISRVRSSTGEIISESVSRDPATGLVLPAPGPVAVAREVYSEYGLGGFWNGVAASLVMVINPTIQYAFYEWLVAARSRVRQERSGGPPRRPSAGEVFMLSAFAKAGATIITYPLLTVKTRMMSARKTDTAMQYTSVADAIIQIARREGVGGYYRGMRTKIVQSVLAAALLFMCKEKITDFTRELLLGRQRKAVLMAAAAMAVQRR